MQNHLGLIKVGKSSNVEHRRRRLETADRCQIAIVYVAEGQGVREPDIHALARSFREYGEWYEGTARARRMIAHAVEIPDSTSWPYPAANQDAIDRWLDQLGSERYFVSADKLLQRCIREIQKWPPTSLHDCRNLDGRIWRLLVRLEYSHDTIYFVGGGKDREVEYTVFDPATGEKSPLPCYTTALNAALTLWPEDEKPTAWDASILECCAAGLIARKAYIRRKFAEQPYEQVTPRPCERTSV